MDIRNFFKPCEITKKIKISDRFTDENQENSEFIIKSITEIENDDIKKQCFDKNGVFDAQKYQAKLVCKSIISPDLSNSELQAYFGVLGEEKVIKTMLLSGEYAFLVKEIEKISGFNEEIFKSVDFLKN